jgi:hypothetical protein
VKFYIQRTSINKHHTRGAPHAEAVLGTRPDDAGCPECRRGGCYQPGKWSLDIGSLEDLILLMDAVGQPVILWKHAAGMVLEIYDEYRE